MCCLSMVVGFCVVSINGQVLQLIERIIPITLELRKSPQL
jgi:hypothetical protein